MYSNRTEILGMSLDLEDNETKALAPISKITMVTAIDFYSSKLHVHIMFHYQLVWCCTKLNSSIM